jgi:hypothetical protein
MKNRKVYKELQFRNRRLIKLSEVKWEWTRNDAKELMATGKITPRMASLVEKVLIMLDGKNAHIKEREDEEEERAMEAEREVELQSANGGDLSELSQPEPYCAYKPKEIDTDLDSGKGFAGTALKLFPNVRQTKIKLGEEDSWFRLFGINKKVGTVITMHLGPNRRLNRYLTFQYKRLFASIKGEVLGYTVWNKALNASTKVKYVKWHAALKDIHIAQRSSHPNRKAWRKSARIFWAIAYNLMINSAAFRVVQITSVLGKKGRWYHRDISVAKLLMYNRSYLKIVKKFRTDMPVRRKWIPSTGKWRPLGISPIAWRIYTKGLAAFLSVFLANSWPKNQHGYTKGRGVQTAWVTILTDVLKSRNIFEFDLVGYFNNITHSCVVRQLARFQVPKHVIMLLVELSCGEVTGISIKELLECMEIQETSTGWKDRSAFSTFQEDWKKHEYLHKYRNGWRNRGFPQGGSLSPLLSILPIILLDESDVKSVSYCDDGIVHGEESRDLLKILQEIFDSNQAGVIVHPEKSGWVRKDGIWLKKLKFVGLLYDPFEDRLSACTRKGSVLPMELDEVGLLSKEADTFTEILSEATRHDGAKPDFSDCPWDPLVERTGIVGEIMTGLCRKWGYVTPHEEYVNWNKWHFYKIILWVVESDHSSLPTTEYRFLANDSGMWQYFRNIWKVDVKLAREMLVDLDSFLVLSISWIDLWEIIEKELQVSKYSYGKTLGEGQDLKKADSAKSTMELNVELLVWHKNMIGNKIKEMLDDGTDLDLGKLSAGDVRLFKLEPHSALASALPESLLHTAVKHNWEVTLFLSRIGWRNMVDSRHFGLLISRLFIGSFHSVKVKQNFALEYEPNSLVDAGYKVTCKRDWAKLLHAERGLNVFNSTTVYSYVLAQLIGFWDRASPKWFRKHVQVERAWWNYYKQFATRLAGRRVGSFRVKDGMWDDIIPSPSREFDEELGVDTTGMQFITPNAAAVGLPTGQKHTAAVKQKAMRALRDGVPIEAIAHSSCSENMYREIEFADISYKIQYKYNLKLIKLYRESCKSKPAGSDWFTWAPYNKGPRKVESKKKYDSPKFRIFRYFK